MSSFAENSNSPAHSARGFHVSQHSFWSEFPELHEPLEQVRELIGYHAASARGPVGSALQSFVQRPGKMLRPAMVIIGAWAGKDGARSNSISKHVLEVATAVETLHLATLIHDDVIDDASRRRGGPTLHTIYGRKHAVLMGDFLLARCFSIIADGTSRENAQRIATATAHIVQGELSQMKDSIDSSLSKRAYLRRIAAKTAMLFGLSLVTGASESKATRREIALLSRIGYSIGMAFQIIDDILDFTANEQEIGKPVASDLRAGLYTLPAIAAAENDPSLATDLLQLGRGEASGGNGPSQTREEMVESILARIEKARGLTTARESAALYTSRARRAAAGLKNGRQREALRTLIDKLLNRSY
ncbi:MAG: polyprenyl synthetase family protein [Spirochaetales bacterium]